MKKIFLTIILGTLLILPNLVFAQDGGGFSDESSTVPTTTQTDRNRDGFLSESTLDVLESFEEQTGLRSFIGGSGRDSLRQPGLDGISGMIYSIIDILKYVVGILAALIITISIIQMIVSGTDKSEEEYKKLKDHILYAVIGVVSIIAIDFFFKNVFVIGTENFLESTRTAQQFALAGSGEIRGIYNFIQAAIATIAILMLVIAGFRLVANAGDEEAVARLKRQIIYGVMGLVLVAVSEFAVKDIIFAEEGTTFDVQRGRELIVSFTNFISGFIALTSFIAFLYAGYLYVVSGSGVVEDQSEKVKKIVIGGILGILIAAGSFAIVNTVVRLDAGESPQIIQDQLDTLSR